MLKKLNLSYTKITDVSILRNVKKLYLESTNISDLLMLVNREELNLSNCSDMTDFEC